MKRISTLLILLMAFVSTYAAPTVAVSSDGTLVITVKQAGDLKKSNFTPSQLQSKKVKLVTENGYKLSSQDVTDFFNVDWSHDPFPFSMMTDLDMSLVDLANNDDIKRLHNTKYLSAATLGTLVLPESLEVFPSGAFDNDNCKWTKIVFPDATKDINKQRMEIAGSAFSNILSIKEVVIGTSVKKIGYNGFNQCSNIRKVDFHYGPKTIDSHAFWGCTGLTIVTIPESVEEIGLGAFENCKGMIAVRLPENLKYIRKEAFAHCAKLTEIVIPKSVRLIENGAFDGCNGLENVYVMGADTKCQNQAFEPTQLTYGYNYSGVGKGEKVELTAYATAHPQGKYLILHYPEEAYEKYVNLYTRLIGTDAYAGQTTYPSWNNKWVYDGDGNKWPTLPDSYFDGKGGDYAGWWNFMLVKKLKKAQIEDDQRLVDGKWFSVCFPFSLNQVQIQTAFGSATEVCEFSGAHIKKDSEGKDYLSLEFKTPVTEMQAHHPYMIRPGLHNAENVIFAGVDVDTDTDGDNYEKKLTMAATVMLDEKGNKYTFKGNYADGVKVPKYSYFYYSGDEKLWANGFYKAKDENVTFTPNTAVVVLEKDNGFGAKSFYFEENEDDNTTTAISTLVAAPQQKKFQQGVYSLDGRRVSEDVNNLNNLPAGLYIVNGKKYLVK